MYRKCPQNWSQAKILFLVGLSSSVYSVMTCCVIKFTWNQRDFLQRHLIGTCYHLLTVNKPSSDIVMAVCWVDGHEHLFPLIKASRVGMPYENSTWPFILAGAWVPVAVHLSGAVLPGAQLLLLSSSESFLPLNFEQRCPYSGKNCWADVRLKERKKWINILKNQSLTRTIVDFYLS